MSMRAQRRRVRIVGRAVTNDDREHQPVELIRDLTLEVGEPKRDRVDGHRRRAERRADDDVVEVEADLNRDVDDEHVQAEGGDVTDE